MNTLNKIIPAIILLAFISFLVLLIVGMVIKSVPLIVSSFAIGFIGYAICEHRSIKAQC